MRTTSIRVGFNVLAVCGSATLAGVMLSIGLSFGGIWQNMPPEDFSAWFAENNGHVSRPIPYVVVPTVVGLVGSTYASWRDRAQRRLWLASAACIGVIAVLTFSYFVPTNAAFAGGRLMPRPSHLAWGSGCRSTRCASARASPLPRSERWQWPEAGCRRRRGRPWPRRSRGRSFDPAGGRRARDRDGSGSLIRRRVASGRGAWSGEHWPSMITGSPPARSWCPRATALHCPPMTPR